MDYKIVCQYTLCYNVSLYMHLVAVYLALSLCISCMRTKTELFDIVRCLDLGFIASSAHCSKTHTHIYSMQHVHTHTNIHSPTYANKDPLDVSYKCILEYIMLQPFRYIIWLQHMNIYS